MTRRNDLGMVPCLPSECDHLNWLARRTQPITSICLGRGPALLCSLPVRHRLARSLRERAREIA